MSTETVVGRRPATVTIAVVFIYLSGLSNAALGILVLLSRYQVAGDDVLAVSLLGAGIILLGLLTLAGASSAARGSRLARGLLTAYVALLAVLHVVTIVTTDWDWTAIAQLAIEVYILIALWTPPGSRHFAHPA